MKKIISILCFILSLGAFAESLAPFELPIYPSGENFSSKTQGKKILINFWASWCTSCVKEIDELEALKKKYPEYIFVGVSAGDTKKKIKKFLKKTGFSYTILMDKDKSFSKGLGVLSLPQTWVIDEKGNITYKEVTPPKELP